MRVNVRLAVLAAVVGCGAAVFTVSLAGVKAESPLEFFTKQNRQQRAYTREPVYVERGDIRGRGFFGQFFGGFLDRDMPPPRRSASSEELERIICRRTCDNAQLVLGILPARRKHGEAEAMCAAAGGGAKTQLVVEKFVPGEGFAPPPPIQTASAAPLLEGRASLTPDAPAQAAGKPACGPAAQSFMTVPIKNDVTLRKGDIVATRNGFKVFVGKGRPPFKESDFVEMDQKKRLASDIRKLKIADR